MPTSQVLFSLIGIVVIIIGCYYATAYIAKKASGQSRGRNRGANRRIDLLERFAISKDKSFCIVEMAGKIYFIGVTNQSMVLLDTLDAWEFAGSEAERNDTASWNTAQSGPYSGKLVNRLASFMVRRTGNTQKTGSTPGTSKMQGTGKSEAARSVEFADVITHAQKKSAIEEPDREQPNDPGGE